MTIALGIVATDGIVLAADTEDSYGTTAKVAQSKIGFAYHKIAGGTCAVTGAGGGLYIDAVTAELLDAYLGKGEVSRKRLEPILRDVLHRFHALHVIPFGQYPSEDRPSFELIVSHSLKHEATLWSTDHSVMHRQKKYAAVGVGAFTAMHLLRRLFTPSTRNVMETAVLAAYVAFEAKELIQGCGQFTQVFCQKGDSFFEFSTVVMAELDLVFREVVTGPQSLDCLVSDEAFRANIGSVSASLRANRRRIKRLMEKAMSNIVAVKGQGRANGTVASQAAPAAPRGSKRDR
jgi:20S proteasome alpha/beta subunit